MTKNGSKHTAQLTELSKHPRPSPQDLSRRLNDVAEQARFTARLDDMVLDFSRQLLNGDDLEALIDWGQVILPKRDSMLAGTLTDDEGNRLGLHTLLRQADSPVARDNIAGMAEATNRLLALGVEDVVAIGIGGSYLGPAMAVLALTPFQQGPDVHFVSNLDPAHLNDTLAGLNPLTTAVIAVSKTFTTRETLVNMQGARTWFEQSGVAPDGRIFAVTSYPEIAVKAGVLEAQILTIDEGVGGRFSLWSSVGLSIMLAIGEEMFTQLLRGAGQMDDHFATAPCSDNLPILGALIQMWNRAFLGYQGQAVIPYDQRLLHLPAWLQQLVMESNGKAAARLATAPIIFGDVGSNAQHSFFQMIHQSDDVIPVDFLAPMNPITITKDAEDSLSRHGELIAQMLAQADCLALGSPEPKANFSGGRPSSLITWHATTPFALGRLLAYYEHVTVVCGWLMQINSFDQPGVELGKSMAAGYRDYANKDQNKNKQKNKTGHIPLSSKAYLDQIKN